MKRTVHRDFTPDLTPRPLAKGDIVRDPYFPLAISVYSHLERRLGGDCLVFSQGDSFCFVALVKRYGALEHADGAPIDVTGIT